MTRLYELYFALSADHWRLKAPLDASGQPFDPELFYPGEQLDVGELFFPLSEPGRPLDVTFGVFGTIVVTEAIGSLLGGLAPEDVQLIPARVESTEERYEALDVLSYIDCIDRDRTAASVTVDADPPYVERGTLASLAPLLEASRI